jgi:phosphoribosylanthranilate isomerase
MKSKIEMKRNIIAALSLMLAFLFSSCNSEAQNTAQAYKTTAKAKVEVIQFHSEHRCETCLKIEEMTRETLKGYPSIPFSFVNVDDEKNEKKAEQFEAFGTALFLYNPKTGEKLELTDFAFMNAHDKDKFVKGLKKYIDDFLKS